MSFLLPVNPAVWLTGTREIIKHPDRMVPGLRNLNINFSGELPGLITGRRYKSKIFIAGQDTQIS